MTTIRTKEQARDIRHKIAEMIPGEYTPVLDDELNRMLIEQVEKIKRESAQEWANLFRGLLFVQPEHRLLETLLTEANKEVAKYSKGDTE